ncbi:sialate O-acetylesterase [uncultured Arcticibacterium sp.]|uniref:sialate O-acetylesterase n=1 Tax=uncultured Arcticibacterium sp. TaxID=2173042 RepID=UPI0030F6E507
MIGRLLGLLFFLLGFVQIGNAQLSIAFPSERAIFQRDNSNQGEIAVYGIGPVNADAVEGRLVPVTSGQGVATDWQVIDSNLLNGAYSGKVKGVGGWYRLEVRSIVNGNVSSSSVVYKVGIGEVFMVAGQSNAQGFLLFNPPVGAFDDRVNGYGYYNKDEIPENPTLTDIRHLDRELNIGPHGQSAWAWGQLGDLLAAKLNVPILFFNVAYEGTTIENWVSSSAGLPTYNDGLGTAFENGAPYSFMRVTLQNHVSIYGLRTILWMQGENDFDTKQIDYKNRLNTLVKKVATDTGKNINWMVSRTSYIFDKTYGQIIAAQNEVVADNSNVFSGPFTDRIQNPRTDGVHLSYSGITELAYAFDRDLSFNVIQSMQPTLGTAIEELKYACNSGNTISISAVKNGFSAYKWVNGSTASSMSIISGDASGLLRDNTGNYHLTEKVTVNGLVPPAPSIIAENDGVACSGKNARFYINSTANEVEWSDGTTGYEFLTNTTDPVYAVQTDQYGCKSARSPTLRASFTPTPEPPTITSLFGSYGACDGESIVLMASSENRIFRWSSGEWGDQLVINGVGEREYQVLTITENGCESAFSEPVSIKIFEKPSPPSLFKSGPYSVGVSSLEDYESFQWFFEGKDLAGQVESEILASENGFYSVKGVEVHSAPYASSCASEKSELFRYEKSPEHNGLIVYPNPVIDGDFSLTSEVPIDAVVSLKDAKGRILMNPFVIQKLSYPQKIRVSSDLPTGIYFLTLDYDGLEKRFKLFFE